jgi:hypothetical protein
MATIAADVLIDALCDWGVEVIFGLPGDGINGLVEALRIRQDKVRFVHKCGMKRQPPLWRVAMPNIPASLVYVWQPLGPGAFIC